MNLNINCVRDILLCVESNKFDEDLRPSEFLEAYPEYSSDDFSYTCLKLQEAGYLKIITKTNRPRPLVIKVTDITFNGHQFLEDIRDDKNWSKTLDIAKSVGSFSVNAISEIAKNVISSVIISYISH